MTVHLNLAVFIVAIVTSIVGFLSCAALDLNAKQIRNTVPMARGAAPGWCSLYNWGMIFFAGTGLMSIAWAMGDKSPVAFVPPIESERVQFSSVFSLWLFVCCAGLAAQRAFRLLHRPKGILAMRTMLMLFAAVALAGCSGVMPPSTTYVSTHERLFNAKVPILQRYEAEHPDEKPAIDDNIAQERALIQSAKQ